MSNAAAASPRASELDRRILEVIAAWHVRGAGLDDDAFDALALDLFAYQVAENEPYRRFVQAGRDRHARPRSWREIPAVPSSAFKDAVLTTFDPGAAELQFHTSGTTAARAGRHYMQRAELYDRALLAGFDRFMLPDAAELAYLNLLPDPRANRFSSLAYMMGKAGTLRGLGPPKFYVHCDELDVEGFRRDLSAEIAAGRPVCIAGTAFAFVSLVDALDGGGVRLRCPAGSRVMETGGFKGRSRTLERTALYERIARCLGVPQPAIVAEYGMTELTSQYYDLPASRGGGVRVKAGPPWLRTLVIDADGRELPRGEMGFLRHVDLANRSSVIAVTTEDRGYAGDEGFVLLGRRAGAPARGCSLDAEELAARRG